MRAGFIAITAMVAAGGCGGRFTYLGAGDASAIDAAAGTGSAVAESGNAVAQGVSASDSGTGDSGAPAPPAPQTCLSSSSQRPGHLALLGLRGSQIVLIDDAGSIRSVDGRGNRPFLQERNGWVAAEGNPTPSTWRIKLFDASGQVRADASGDLSTSEAGSMSGFTGLRILSDGTAVTYAGTGATVLTPDGRVLVRPSFSTDPDARGWVGATLPSTTLILGIPVMLNVPSGEVRRLTYLAPNDEWAPIVAGSRRLYLSEMSGTVVLVDESVDGIHIERLPGWARGVLEIDGYKLSKGRFGAYVALGDGVRNGVPIWLYDVGTQTLASALPDGTVPADAKGMLVGESVTVSSGGARVWSVDLATGALLDYRAGLSVRLTRPPADGTPDWQLLTDNRGELYRYDRNGGKLEDLHLLGNASVSGRRALVMQNGRPRVVLQIDDAHVIGVVGGDSLVPTTHVTLRDTWAVGFVPLGGVPGAGAATTPAWRVDLVTGEIRLFPAVDPALMALGGYSAAPIFSANSVPVLADGSVAIFLYDGFGASLYVGAPDAPWRKVGRAAREATWLGWADGPAFAIAAEKDCRCYTPLQVPWKSLPPGSPPILPGTSLQFAGLDGADLFPPSSDEHLDFDAFSDPSHTCALTRSDTGERALYDLGARTRRALGPFDRLSWVVDAP
jgi:hypothetical protein